MNESIPSVNIPGTQAPKEYRYIVYEIDLTVARNNAEFSTGVMNALAVQEIKDINANLEIRFESPSNEVIKLTQGDTFNFARGTDMKLNNFSKVYITNTAVATGTAKLVFAYNIEIHKLLRITSDIIQEGVLQQVVTIGITATAIPTTALTNRINLLIYNGSANTIYIGSSTVTTAGATQGIPMPTGATMAFTIGQGVTLYGIAAIASNINVLEGA